MVDIRQIVEQNKSIIVLAGFAVALLYILDVLPPTTDILSLEGNVKFVYGAIIAAAGFVFYNFYASRVSSVKRSFQMERTQPSRNLSDPNYGKRLQQQRGTASAPRPRPQAPPTPSSSGRPSKEFLDKFDKEDV